MSRVPGSSPKPAMASTPYPTQYPQPMPIHAYVQQPPPAVYCTPMQAAQQQAMSMMYDPTIAATAATTAVPQQQQQQAVLSHSAHAFVPSPARPTSRGQVRACTPSPVPSVGASRAPTANTARSRLKHAFLQDVARNTEKNLRETEVAMYSLNPNTGFVVTVNPEDPRAPDRPPLCWITTSSSLAVDDAAGNQGKFLLMSTRNSIVTVNAHVEAFCMELADGLLEFVLSKEQLDGGHHESFDYKQLLHNALQLYMEQKKKDSSRSRQDSRKKKDKGSKKGGHRSDGDSSADDVSLNAMFVLTEVSNMLVSRSFRDPVSMFLEHQQRTVDNGLKPTLENMLDELAKLTFYRPRYTEGDDDADTSLKGIAAFAIKRVQFGVIYYDVKDVMSKASPYYEWTVKCTSFDAFNRLSRLFYGVRCIVAHGRGQRTLQDTLPSAHEAFKTQDFTLVSTGTYSLPSGEGDVEKTVSMLNEVRQKAEDHVRHGKVLGLNYHDFVNFLNFARAFVELLSTVADYALDQDRAKQDMQQDEDKNPTAFQLSLS